MKTLKEDIIDELQYTPLDAEYMKREAENELITERVGRLLKHYLENVADGLEVPPSVDGFFEWAFSDCDDEKVLSK